MTIDVNKYKIEMKLEALDHISFGDSFLISVKLFKKCECCPTYLFYRSFAFPIPKNNKDLIDWKVNFKVFNEQIQKMFEDKEDE